MYASTENKFFLSLSLVSQIILLPQPFPWLGVPWSTSLSDPYLLITVLAHLLKKASNNSNREKEVKEYVTSLHNSLLFLYHVRSDTSGNCWPFFNLYFMQVLLYCPSYTRHAWWFQSKQLTAEQTALKCVHEYLLFWWFNTRLTHFHLSQLARTTQPVEGQYYLFITKV